MSRRNNNKYINADGDEGIGLINGKPVAGRGWSWTAILAIACGLLGAAMVVGWAFAGVWWPKTQICGTTQVSADDVCVDYLIGGGGTSGLAAARRLALSEGFPSVLVIESGADLYDVDDNIKRTRDVLDVLDYKNRYPGKYHWQWRQPLTPDTLNEEAVLLQGRVLGGGSSINNGVVVRGSIEYWDQDVSAAVDNDEAWTGAAIYARYKDNENFTNFGLYTPDSTRGDGTLETQTWQVTVRPTTANADNHFVADLLGTALGVPVVDDYNDPSSNLCAYRYLSLQQRADTVLFDRSSSQTSFLWPLEQNPRVNLKVSVNSTINNILFDGNKAVGYTYYDTDAGITRHVYARKGVFMNMQLNNAPMLQRAGIGPAALLAAQGITPRLVNENVGRNWKMHTATWILSFVSPNVTGANSEAPNSGFPQFGGGEGFYVDDISVNGRPNRRSFEGIALNFPNVFAFKIFHLDPKYTGTIDIQNTNPEFPAFYDGNVFSLADDMLSARTFFRRLISTLEAADPNVICVSIDPMTLADDGLLDTWIRTYMNRQQYHHSSSARMGTSVANSVVDVACKVHGIENLHIADLTILPAVPDGNTATPATIVGDTCARFATGELQPTPGARKRHPIAAKRSNSVDFRHVQKRTRIPRMTDQEMHSVVAGFMDTVHATLPSDMSKAIINPIVANSIWAQLSNSKK